MSQKSLGGSRPADRDFTHLIVRELENGHPCYRLSLPRLVREILSGDKPSARTLASVLKDSAHSLMAASSGLIEVRSEIQEEAGAGLDINAGAVALCGAILEALDDYDKEDKR